MAASCPTHGQRSRATPVPSLVLAALLAGCGPSAATLGARARAAHALSSWQVRTSGTDDPRSTPHDRALARDPALRASVQRAEADLVRADGEHALPVLELEAQAWNVPLTRPWALDEADMYMLQVRQVFTPAGARDARARARALDVLARLSATAVRAREQLRRVADTWIEARRGHLHHAVHEAHTTLVTRMQGAARARIAAGTMDLADAARIDLLRAETERQKSRYEADETRARVQWTALVGGEPDLAVPWAWEAADAGPATVDEAVAQALRLRPEIAASDAETDAARARAEAASFDRNVPEVTLGGGYWQNPRMGPGFGLSLAISLPWFNGARRAEAEAATHDVRAAESEAAGARREVGLEVVDAWERRREALGLLDPLRRSSLPAAEHVVAAVEAGFQGGRIPLLAWIEADAALLELRVEEADLQADLERAEIDLALATGSGGAR